MDLLVGRAVAARSRDYRGALGPVAPARASTPTLPDGGRLEVDGRRGRRSDPDLPDAAFAAPPPRGLPARSTRPRRAASGARDERTRACACRRFAKINLGLEVLGTRAGRLSRAAHALPDDRPARRHRAAAAAAAGVTRRAATIPRVPAGRARTWRRGRPPTLRRYAERTRRRRDRDREADPGGRRPGRREQQRGRGAAGPRPALAAGPRARRASTALARRLGADVPFFLVGGTALGLARGDEVYPLRRQVRAHVVVVDPGPSGLDRGRLPQAGREFDTPGKQPYDFPLCIEGLGGRSGASALLANDLEQAALEEAPDLRGPGEAHPGYAGPGGGRARRRSPGAGRRTSACSTIRSGPAGPTRPWRRRASRAFRGRTLSLDQYRKALVARRWARQRGA